MKALLYSWMTAALILCLVSCEPDWNFDSNYQSEVVVEGGIGAGGFAKVYLSQSKILNSTWDSIALSKLPVMSAKVTVSDGSRTEILVGRVDKGRLPYFVYTGSQIRGEAGKTYTLTVVYRGKEITARTVIPQPVLLDSIRLQPSAGCDTLYQATAYFNDPVDETNYYKIFTQVEEKDNDYYNAFMGTFSDEVLVPPVAKSQIYRGFRHTELNKYTPFFVPGEKVNICFSQIPKEGFRFWSHYENEILNSGNPVFPNTTNLPGNIIGGLGIWMGYGTAVYHVEVKDTCYRWFNQYSDSKRANP